MKIAIIGASGFIGKLLTEKLNKHGHKIYVIGRNRNKLISTFPTHEQIVWNEINKSKINDIEVVINLAGENIAEKRWTAKRKKQLIESRTNQLKQLKEVLHNQNWKPKVIFQASAIGFYPNSEVSVFDENSAAGNSFLSEVVISWEKEAAELATMCNRFIVGRIGIVLSEKGGILAKMMPPFKFFAGGHTGNGKQWLSWIHIDDLLAAILYLIENEHCNGIYNLCTSQAVEMRTFAKLIGKALKRPSWLHLPASVLRITFGEMANEILLKGNKVYPTNLIKDSFEFEYSDIETAINKLLIKKA